MSSAADQSQAPTLALDASSRSFVAFCRWASAIVVMLSHLRGMLFIGWGGVPQSARHVWVAALYASTAFFHEAVIIFFVISGFLVAGPNINRLRIGAFHTSSYAIDRFTRIYVTAAPALVFTLIVDAIGRRLFAWTGFYNGLNSLVRERSAAAFYGGHGPADFLGNLAMLQPVHVASLGTNVPLWSLSYEVWFYVWFGMIAFAFKTHRPLVSLVVILATLGLFAFDWTAVYFLVIWCMGALAYQWTRWPAFLPLALIAFGLSLLLTTVAGFNVHTNVPLKPLDVVVGASFAWILAIMKRRSYRIWSRTEKTNQFLSSFSFSLYVIHFPTMFLLIGVFSTILGITGASLSRGLVPSAAALTLYFSTAASALIIAFLFSRLFESHTGIARRWLKSRI